jgi:(p)ppGpp synthase/HD superfamily hydrolase
MDPGLTKKTARRIASKAHRGQMDLQGVPYLKHPLRVSEAVTGRLRRFRRDLVDFAAVLGILHDAIEDSDLTFDDLFEEGASNDLLLALDMISRKDGERYGDYINYMMYADIDPDVKYCLLWVKLSDIEHNTRDDRRYEGDESMRKRYKKSWNKILDRLELMENEIMKEGLDD